MYPNSRGIEDAIYIIELDIDIIKTELVIFEPRMYPLSKIKITFPTLVAMSNFATLTDLSVNENKIFIGTEYNVWDIDISVAIVKISHHVKLSESKSCEAIIGKECKIIAKIPYFCNIFLKIILNIVHNI